MSVHRALVSHSCIVVEALDSVFLVVWTGNEPVAEELRSAIAACKEHAREWHPCGLIVGVPPTMGIPSDEIRSLIQIEVRALDPFLSCGATLITRKGLMGIAHRAIVSAMQLVSRPTHPERIFPSTEEAAEFVHKTLLESGGHAPTVSAMVETYEALRSRVSATA